MNKIQLRMQEIVCALLLSVLGSIVCSTVSATSASLQHSAEPTYQLQTIAEGLESPWAMAFLPNGDALVTEREGRLRVVRKQTLLDKPVSGVPEVYFAGQGGLLDVMLDKNFEQNRTLYLSFSHGKRKANATRLMSAKLLASDDGYTLSEQNILFTAQPMKQTAHHHGARIAQLADGSLIMPVGDGYNYREQAQVLDNHFGKVIRINANGSAAKDNPFISRDDALPEIYSYGHRNPQGLMVVNDKIYLHEHGPKGGDEVNIIEAGTNYGWPVATFGIDYSGAQISPFTSYDGMRSPEINWTPSIAPSSMALHNGFLYVTALAEKSIRKLTINDDTITDTGIVYPKLNTRLRDIVSGPDGHLYVLTDGSNAKMIKIIDHKTDN